jgi:hypothetical protein
MKKRGIKKSLKINNLNNKRRLNWSRPRVLVGVWEARAIRAIEKILPLI